MQWILKHPLTTKPFFIWAILFLGLGINSGYGQNINQPINFLHQTHVALNELTCEFCHIYARRSAVSGVPPVGICAGCHLHIPGTVPAQSNEIRKIIDTYWKKNRPIPWKRIHDLPDFIDFSHEQHITVGFDCTDCHGDIMKTKTPEPFAINNETPQSMGWCISCHQQENPTLQGKILGELRATRGASNSSPAAEKPDGFLKASRDCIVCHK